MILKKVESYKEADWEEVPDEDLWDYGELNKRGVALKIMTNLHLGMYRIIREVNSNDK